MIRRSRRNAERGARRGCRERHCRTRLVNGRVRFIPTSGFTGTASFRYVTSEGGNEATSTVSVLVASVSGPIVVQDNISTMIDTALDIPASRLLGERREPAGTSPFCGIRGRCRGWDGHPVRHHGSVRAGCRIADDGSFRYTVSDGVTTATGTVTVSIRENRAPVRERYS